KQEYITGYIDGSCGGFVDPLDWDLADATYFYMQEKLRDNQ
ncbi:39148_t:CDS:1, partial [Gigaspora margarita]